MIRGIRAPVAPPRPPITLQVPADLLSDPEFQKSAAGLAALAPLTLTVLPLGSMPPPPPTLRSQFVRRSAVSPLAGKASAPATGSDPAPKAPDDAPGSSFHLSLGKRIGAGLMLGLSFAGGWLGGLATAIWHGPTISITQQIPLPPAPPAPAPPPPAYTPTPKKTVEQPAPVVHHHKTAVHHLHRKFTPPPVVLHTPPPPPTLEPPPEINFAPEPPTLPDLPLPTVTLTPPASEAPAPAPAASTETPAPATVAETPAPAPAASTETPAPTTVAETLAPAPAASTETPAPVAKTSAPAASTQTDAHPITDAINDYVLGNHLNQKYLLSVPEQPGAAEHVQTGLEVTSGYAMAGTAMETVTALHAASEATALGAQAQALGFAAQQAAAAGNLTQAGALAAQARATGNFAMQVGNQAKAAAGVASGLSIAGGGIAVVDGGIDLGKGFATTSTVKELHRVANARMHELKREHEVTPEAQQDYQHVNQQLNELHKLATHRKERGGAKVVFGGMMIASPFTGPAAPIVGGVGAVGYLATSIVPHFFHHHPKPAAPPAVVVQQAQPQH
ncbi:MAG: hypothetical protein ACYCW6_02675 [Candidatus Xenobia bacterium]